jgi:hypothetical protein
MTHYGLLLIRLAHPRRLAFAARVRMASLAEGATVEEILADFPTLTETDVRAVIALAAASAEEDLPVPAIPGRR